MATEQYHKITLGNPPKELARKVIQYLNNNSLILDCGCGAGNDSLFFASQGHNVIALDKETSILENRLNNLSNVNGKVITIETDIIDFQIPKIDCFYSSLTLSFLGKKDFYTLWNNISTKLDKHTIIGINIFGDRDEWYRDTEDRTFMDKKNLYPFFQTLWFWSF